MFPLRVVISGTISGEYDFPSPLFSGYVYEGWGNAWALIEGVGFKYIPSQELIEHPDRFEDIDILICESGQTALIDEACERCFVMATESGAGFELDRRNSLELKQEFIERMNRCGLVLSTTHGGRAYLELFLTTPVLETPLPMDLEVFQPREVQKFIVWSVCIGEVVESCYDDRPLQILAIRLIQEEGGVPITTIAPHSRNFGEEELRKLVGEPLRIEPHLSLLEVSKTHLAHSHVSMMLAQRSTFGRFVYVSWAIGVPCIATRYQCQQAVCPELTVGHEEIPRMRRLLRRLRDDEDFYRAVRAQGLARMERMSLEATAVRITSEILPVYFKKINGGKVSLWERR